MTIKLHRDFLIDELVLPESAIKDTITGQRRWSTDHEVIFAYNDKFYRAHYSVGSTENQWETPWEYEQEVECTEVIIVEKTVKVWQAV